MTTSLSEGQRWVTSFNSSTTVTIPPFAVLECLSAGTLADYVTGGNVRVLCFEVGKVTRYQEEFSSGTYDDDPCSPGVNPYDTTGELEGFQTRSLDACFNGPASIKPLRFGSVTFDLPTMARVCGTGFAKGYLTIMSNEFELRQRTPNPTPSGTRAGPSIFWLLGKNYIESGGDAICLICRKAYSLTVTDL